ncbi:MAG TPA: radical SAM protein, partial [Candidatus Gastranaerophilaceae bacterium]|nr:radical SAM protein [Candidatus Gastranaerophilaceae bacterium]
WTIGLCEAIIESGLKITWSSNTRADTADDEMAELMYDSGCRLVSIGVESGSQFILDKIGKKVTIDDIRDTVKIFKRAKIKTYNYFVIGLPWDDEDTIEQTINFAIELDSDFVSFYTATPLPGTRFFRYAKEHNLLEKQNSWANAYYEPVVKTHCLSKERIMELHKQAVKRFYLRPMYILRTIINIRSFAEIKNYFLAGIGLLLRK